MEISETAYLAVVAFVHIIPRNIDRLAEDNYRRRDVGRGRDCRYKRAFFFNFFGVIRADGNAGCQAYQSGSYITYDIFIQ
jgi:hypothetical protein